MNRPTPLLSLVILTLMLAGCGAGTPEEREDPEDPGETGITVSGKLLFPNGSAASEITALVAGQVITPNVDGSFQAEDVEAPYDVSVKYDAFPAVISFQGLTVEEPVLLIQSPGSVEREATITFTAYSFDPTGTYDYAVCSGPVFLLACGGHAMAQTTPTTNTVRWRGPASIPARIVSAQGTVAGLQPRMFTNYTHFASRTGMTFVDGATSDYSLVYAPVATGTITGTTSAPAGFTVTHRGLGLMTGDDMWGVISYEADSAVSPIEPAFSLATPAASGFSYYVTATAEQGDASVTRYQPVASANATDVTLDLPTPPQLRQPANNQVGLTENMLFEWTPVEGALYMLGVVAPTATSYLIVTANPEARLPDLSALGISLPSAETLDWYVEAYAPIASVDELAIGVDYTSIGDTYAASARRSFTTAP